MEDIHFLAFTDFTKLGTFNQQDVNQHAHWMAHILGKNPKRILTAKNGCVSLFELVCFMNLIEDLLAL